MMLMIVTSFSSLCALPLHNGGTCLSIMCPWFYRIKISFSTTGFLSLQLLFCSNVEFLFPELQLSICFISFHFHFTLLNFQKPVVISLTEFSATLILLSVFYVAFYSWLYFSFFSFLSSAKLWLTIYHYLTISP